MEQAEETTRTTSTKHMIISFFLRGIRKDCEESGLVFKHHQLASEITITSWLAGRSAARTIDEKLLHNGLEFELFQSFLE